jgi:hypothetical protein
MILRFMGTMDSSPAAPPTIPAAPPTIPAAPRRRLWPWLLLAAVLGVAVWYYPTLKAQAEVGSAYAARIGCSCRYVQGREMDSCTRDFEPGMEIISVADDPETKTVTGSVPMMASRSARYQGASGCVFVDE